LGENLDDKYAPKATPEQRQAAAQALDALRARLSGEAVAGSAALVDVPKTAQALTDDHAIEL
jgi:hypothetical protein